MISLISIRTFCLSLALFFVREKYLNRKINLHFLRVPAKNCRKRKLVWSSLILVLRIYWGLSSLRPDKAVGGHFVKIFWSSWTVHVIKKDVWLVSLWENFAEVEIFELPMRTERKIFFVLFYSFHHSAHVLCETFRWRQAKSMSELRNRKAIMATERSRAKARIVADLV